MEEENLIPLAEYVNVGDDPIVNKLSSELMYSYIIGRGLLLVAYAHAKHFEVSNGTSGSYARHMALDEFYKGLQNDIDALAEVAMANMEIKSILSGGDFNDDIIEELNTYLDKLVRLHEIEKDPALLSLLENIMVRNKTCIYKFTKLQ